MQIKTMRQIAFVAVLFLISIVQPGITMAQSRGAQQPQRGQRGTPPKPPAKLTLRQVIESLSSLRNSARVEGLISKSGVQFEATPAVVDILKQFGASPKLISMIPPPPPPPPPPPEPPAPKVAGPLTIVCEPKDCDVVVEEKYEGTTNQNRKTVNGLSPGETTVQVFAEGYERVTRRISMEEDRAAEEKFSLKPTELVRREGAKASMLETMAGLGGVDGLAELGDVEGAGTMEWRSSSGSIELWAMTFNKRIGRDLVATFKTMDGQCTATILGQTAKQECKGGLRSGGDKIAEQGTSLFLSYQLQDVMQALLKRPLITSEMDPNRLDSVDTKDSYVFTIGSDGFPADLVYRIGDTDAPVHVQYSNYLHLNKGRYPGRISIGRLNAPPAWTFTLHSVRSRVVRAQ
jgi:hypothetical protein